MGFSTTNFSTSLRELSTLSFCCMDSCKAILLKESVCSFRDVEIIFFLVERGTLQLTPKVITDSGATGNPHILTHPSVLLFSVERGELHSYIGWVGGDNFGSLSTAFLFSKVGWTIVVGFSGFTQSWWHIAATNLQYLCLLIKSSIPFINPLLS